MHDCPDCRCEEQGADACTWCGVSHGEPLDTADQVSYEDTGKPFNSALQKNLSRRD